MGTDLNIGHATAYAYAKSKGYTGTEEQFATELAQFAQNAQQVAEDRAAVEQLVDEFLNTTAPAVIQDVTDEGTSQVERVAGAGTAQVTRVGQAGNTQIDAVGAAGTTQIGLVTAEGTTQVTRVQDKGDEVIDSIPADYTALTEEVSDLNRQLSDVDDRLTTLDGKIFTEWEIGQRYISNGQEAWATNSDRMVIKRGTYLNLKAGTVVALKNLQEYQFLIGYSTDGGTTWQGGSNREDPFTLANDCIAFITIKKKSGSFTEEEVNTVAKNSVVILMPDSDVTGVNTQIIDGISIGNANFGAFELKASEHGIATQWISAGLTNYLSATKYGDYIPASKGDVFLISAEELVSYPSLFTSIGLTVYELNSGGTSVRSTDLTDISAPVKYTVQNENTVKICIYGNLKAESTSITTGYREIFEYKLNVLKQLSASGIDEILTEAGDTWEV